MSPAWLAAPVFGPACSTNADAGFRSHIFAHPACCMKVRTALAVAGAVFCAFLASLAWIAISNSAAFTVGSPASMNGNQLCTAPAATTSATRILHSPSTRSPPIDDWSSSNCKSDLLLFCTRHLDTTSPCHSQCTCPTYLEHILLCVVVGDNEVLHEQNIVTRFSWRLSLCADLQCGTGVSCTNTGCSHATMVQSVCSQNRSSELIQWHQAQEI